MCWDCRLDAWTDENDKPVAPGTPGAYLVAPGGYRGYLAEMLQQQPNVTFDFVGGRYLCGNHEGFSGNTIAQLSGYATDAMHKHQPDVVLFMGGTNDFFFEITN